MWLTLWPRSCNTLPAATVVTLALCIAVALITFVTLNPVEAARDNRALAAQVRIRVRFRVRARARARAGARAGAGAGARVGARANVGPCWASA